MNFGIDKIGLTTKDFIIKNPFELERFVGVIKPNQTTPFLPIDTGQTTVKVDATKIIKNTDHYNLTVNWKGLKLLFNPSKFYHKYYLSNQQKVNQCIDAIISELNEKGIYLSNTKVFRLDVAKQMISPNNRSIKDYIPAFQNLGISRMKNVENRYTTHYWSSGHREICLYDKSVESNLTEPNLLRTEPRLLDTKNVKKETGIYTLYDLQNISDKEIQSFYSGYLNKHLFPKSVVKQLTFDFSEHVNFLVQRKGICRNPIEEMIIQYGVTTMKESGIDDKRFREILSEAGFNWHTIRKAIIRYRNRLESFNKIPVQTLIDELKLMFAA